MKRRVNQIIGRLLSMNDEFQSMSHKPTCLIQPHRIERVFFPSAPAECRAMRTAPG